VQDMCQLRSRRLSLGGDRCFRDDRVPEFPVRPGAGFLDRLGIGVGDNGMSINDPLVIRYIERHQFWFMTQGKETFFDEQRRLIVFPSKEAAAEWCMKTFPGKEIAYFEHL